MHVKNIPLYELWELGVLEISDPTVTANENDDLSDYSKKIFSKGRHEVELPWKSNAMYLPDNKELRWKRHERRISKLRSSNFFNDY